jgi:hypothetical protein
MKTLNRGRGGKALHSLKLALDGFILRQLYFGERASGFRWVWLGSYRTELSVLTGSSFVATEHNFPYSLGLVLLPQSKTFRTHWV